MQTEKYCAIIGVVGGMFTKILGGYDYSLKAMLLLMVIDIVAGFVCAALFDTSQYSKNGVSSSALIKGAVRKISILGIVAVGVVIDKIMNMDYVRNGVVMYFIATEGISILEHMVVIGLPVPAFVTKMLERLKSDTENEADNNGKREYRGKRLKE